MLPKISLIDRYIIKQLIFPWIFSLAICTTLAELIGISFEQIFFLTERQFPLISSLQVHLLKLPAFLALALPFSLLIATILAYSQLSSNNEIIALQSFGTSLIRLIVPAVTFSLLVAISLFFWDAFIVPYTNYQAAIVIENEFKIDRNTLEKYHKKDIIYQEFSESDKQKNLELLLVADYFDGRQLLGVTWLQFTDKHLHKIVIANSAIWNNSEKLWDLLNGSQYTINNYGIYTQVDYFEHLSVYLAKNLLNYVQNYRDNREMNILELYQRLKILKITNNIQAISQLKVNIQEKYAFPFTCVVFALIGVILGANYQLKIHNLTLIVVIIFTYQAIKFLSTSFCVAGLIPINFGIWLPNIIGLFLSSILLSCNEHFTSRKQPR